MNWNTIRNDFPVAENITYFLSAGMSPLPNVVLNKITEEYQKLNQFGDIFWSKDKAEIDEFRVTLAQSMGADASNVAFTSSNSVAMSLVALSLKNNISANFNIISLEEEFPSNSVPFEYQKITMKYVKPENHRYSIASIMDSVDTQTVAVVVSHVQFATGFRLDIFELGEELKKRNILFIVNATQSFPFYPVDVKAMNIDVLTCSVHKWGFAGHVGTIFYTSSEFRNKYPSPVAGWLSVKPAPNEFIHSGKNVPFQLHENSDQYLFGTYNLQTMLGLKTAYCYIEQIGYANIRTRIIELSDYLINKIGNLPLKIITPVAITEERSPIISFTLNDFSSRECIVFLEQLKVHVSLRNGFIRVSLNIFNNKWDIDKLYEGLVLFLKQ